MTKTFAVIGFLLLLLAGCKKTADTKESDQKHCWQIVDNVGSNLNKVCDKTEAELIDCIRNNICGIYNNPNPTTCNYYNLDGNTFCWTIGGNYFPNLTEDQAAFYARCFYGNTTANKVNCTYGCAYWYNRHKYTYKPNNSVTYSQVRFQQYCGDTLATLYQGRQITIKDDLDSLIVVQFSNNGVNW